MSRYHLESVFTPGGWQRDLIAEVSEQGFITHLGAASPVSGPEAVERVGGIVVPGMANAHSHAFQRAMAGHTEYRSQARDSFWTWRGAMYALANRIEPDDLEVVAAQLFVEMLKRGYTTVAEFHYLHRRRDGSAYTAANALWDAVGNAAAMAGIGITFLPTLYQTSDFGAQPLRNDQARFAFETDAFVHAVESRVNAERRDGGHRARSGAQRTGVAFHSLRAVPLENVREVTRRLRENDPHMPTHVHVAEQILEVKACLRETGKRPIELLDRSGCLTPRTTVIHATHADGGELDLLAAAGARICVCPTTEANLGDGFFDTTRYLRAGGRLCVGSDSQSTVSPAEELRWLEYQQRLRKRRRAVLGERGEPHVGTRLWSEAARRGAAALGQPAGAIEVGRRADWLVLDASHPALAGGSVDTALDRLLFAGGEAAIRDVMVAGRWLIKDQRHAQEGQLQARFADVMRRLAPQDPGT